jgi:hypothetical protein
MWVTVTEEGLENVFRREGQVEGHLEGEHSSLANRAFDYD